MNQLILFVQALFIFQALVVISAKKSATATPAFIHFFLHHVK